MTIPSNLAPTPPSKSSEVKPGKPASHSSDAKVEEIGKQLPVHEPISMDLDFDATPNLENLLTEILERIFSHLYTPSDSKVDPACLFRLQLPSKSDAIKAMHRELSLVSKSINKNLISTENHWVNVNQISLRDLGCKNSKEAVQYIIDHQLPFANLLDFNDVDDEDLINLSRSCPELRSLSLNSETFTEYQLAEMIGKLKHFRSLNIQCSQFKGSDKFTEALGNLVHLRSLNLGECFKLSGDDQFAEALGKLTNLENLSLCYCKNLSGIKITEALGNLNKLRNLNLRNGINNPGDLLIKKLKKLSLLKSLNLTSCEQLSGDHLKAIAKDHPHLQELNLTAWRHMPAEQIIEALKALMQLEILNLDYCYNISGDQFIEIAKISPHLQSLSMDCCEQVSSDQIEEMLKHLVHLKYLYFFKIPISVEKRTDLANQFPMITFLI